VPGAIVECGVWRGGNMMAAALTLQHLGVTRPIYLFDTFEGMTAPEGMDVDYSGVSARVEFDRLRRRPEKTQWCEASLDEVCANMSATGYRSALIHFVKGPVELTLSDAAPADIALLRLDTDWYASTLHELQCLYPRVSRRGVVVIDDYGHWEGARRAVDEYLVTNGIHCLLHRIDYTAREFVKV
jgi:O-methyltransferase